MQKLFEGYMRFKKEIYPHRQSLFKSLARYQSPETLMITCSDSRVVPELILQAAPGDLFICRNVGNLVPPYGEPQGGVSAAIEYALGVLGVRNIVICGHSDCGAMKALLHSKYTTDLPSMNVWLRQADVAKSLVCECGLHYGEDQLQSLIKENVISQLEHLRTHPSVAARLAVGELELFGWVYEIETGEVLSYDAKTDRFVLFDNTLPSATPRRRVFGATR
jgi:carbonic anhydrase